MCSSVDVNVISSRKKRRRSSTFTQSHPSSALFHRSVPCTLRDLLSRHLAVPMVWVTAASLAAVAAVQSEV